MPNGGYPCSSKPRAVFNRASATSGSGRRRRRLMSRLQWGRIVAGAAILELILIIVLVPLLQYRVIGVKSPILGISVLVFGFLVSWWFVAKVRERHLLH